jgi:hypothetical protein
MRSSSKNIPGSTRTIEHLGVTLLAVAYLLPVGDAPWFSFWREWTAFIAVLLIVLGALSTLRDLRLPLVLPLRSSPSIGLGLAALCGVQWVTGIVHYHSDALLASLYLAGFSFAALAAASLPQSHRDSLADRLALAMLIAALVSAPLAVLQWIGWLRLDMDMPVAGGRPVAHMEQANLLCSLLIQGALGAWRLVASARLRSRTAAFLCLPIMLSIVLTQSRVALLAASVIVVVAVWRRTTLAEHSLGRAAIASALAVITGALLLPWIDAHVGLAGASLSERVSEGRRPAAWALFVDAAMTRPWAGWGVLQNGVAQFAVANRHPALAYVFSSAHDVVLDLMIWFGVPVGLLAGAALVFGTVRRVVRSSDAAALAPALAVTMLLLHGLVELPLHYAYFLLPLGLYMGLTGPPMHGPVLHLPTRTKPLVPAFALVSLVGLALIGREYIRIADIRPIVAYDAKTGLFMLEAELPLPDVYLLDQLKAFHAFAALPVAGGQSNNALDAARFAMLRAPYQASIERYALLAGRNGRTDDAREALNRLCKFETPKQCDNSKRAWEIRRRQWPDLPDWPTAAEPQSAP